MRIRNILIGIVIPVASLLTHPRASASMHLGMSQGLSNGCVMRTVEDSQGNIWVSTDNGLNRWDGSRFHTYTAVNSGLESSGLGGMAVARNKPGYLWVGSQRNGTYMVNCTTYEIERTHIPGTRSKDVADITTAPEKGIWITDYYYGPQHYDPVTNRMSRSVPEMVKGLPAKAWTAVEGPDHKLYIGHVDRGFSVVDTMSRTFRNFRAPDIPSDKVYAVCVDNNRNVWIGTEKGAAMYTPSTGLMVKFVHNPADPRSIGAGSIHSIYMRSDGTLWFATSRQGVSILDIRSNAFTDIASVSFVSLPLAEVSDGSSTSFIWSIFEDSYGNVWLGKYRTGMDFISHIPPLISPMKFLNEKGQPNPAWAVSADAAGKVWVGSDRGIIELDSRGNRKREIMLPDADRGTSSFISSIAVDSRNHRIWVGTHENGVLVYDNDSGTWQTVGGVTGKVCTLTMHADSVYIGTDHGLYTAPLNEAAPVAVESGNVNRLLPDKMVNCISFDSRGRMWLGMFGRGMYIFGDNGRLLAHHEQNTGFPSNTVNHIIQDRNHGTWVATASGLVRFDRGDIRKYHSVKEVDDLKMTHIMSLAEDSRGCVWASAVREVLRIDPNNEKVSIYTGYESGKEGAYCGGASALNLNGDIYFPSERALVRIRPMLPGDDDNARKVVATGISAWKHGVEPHNGREVPVIDGKARIPYNESTFTVTFAIQDLAMMMHAEFSCMLQGLDQNWNYLSGSNSVTYTDVDPGTYHFLVRQRLSNGEWSEPMEIAVIEVTPPLWLTWWAKCIYVLLAAALCCWIYTLIRHRIRMQRELALQADRISAGQALTEERLRFYTNVTHELRTPLTLIMGPLEDMVSDPSLPQKFSYKLQVMHNSADQLMSLINGILEFRKTETQNRRLNVRMGNPANLLREIGLRFKELNRNPNTEIILDIEPDSPDMYIDPDMLTIIINNLASNAVKYTPKGSITFGIHTDTDATGKRRTRISVSDTGYGISSKAQTLIFDRYYQAGGEHQASGTGIGLALVKQLADLHRASLTVDSQEGKGSTFTLTLDTDETYPDALHFEDQQISLTVNGPKADAGDGSEDTTASENARRKILVVEDNDDIREYIANTLADEADIIQAHNGLEGMRMATEEMPDIIISDIMMPEMDGISMCRSLKGELVTSHIPIILLTAKDSIDDKETGYESGADSYITKPFSSKLLKSRIHNLIMTRRRMSEYLMKQVQSLQYAESGGVEDTDIQADAKEVPCAGSEPISDDRTEVTKNLTALDRQFLDKLFEIVSDNIDNEDLSVGFLADKFCMSNSTLYRKVTALLQISPNEYVRHVRMEKAVELLRTRKYSISDIAYQTGFGSHSSFNKVFRKEFGMTPTEYMERNGGRN